MWENAPTKICKPVIIFDFTFTEIVFKTLLSLYACYAKRIGCPSMVPGSAASFGNLLEMKIPEIYHRPTKPEILDYGIQQSVLTKCPLL